MLFLTREVEHIIPICCHPITDVSYFSVVGKLTVGVAIPKSTRYRIGNGLYEFMRDVFYKVLNRFYAIGPAKCEVDWPSLALHKRKEWKAQCIGRDLPMKAVKVWILASTTNLDEEMLVLGWDYVDHQVARGVRSG
jgi:hypothetical protein